MINFNDSVPARCQISNRTPMRTEVALFRFPEMHRVHRNSPHVVYALNPKAPTSPTPQFTSANPQPSWRKQVQQFPPLPPSIDHNQDPAEPKFAKTANTHMKPRMGLAPIKRKPQRIFGAFLQVWSSLTCCVVVEQDQEVRVQELPSKQALEQPQSHGMLCWSLQTRCLRSSRCQRTPNQRSQV